MSSETAFYLLGGVLVVSALVLTFTGLRRGSFPPRPALIGVTGLFALLVAATMTVSVLQAEEEQEHREAELAEHEEEAAAEAEAPASGGIVDQEQGATPAGGALEAGPGPGERPVGGEGQQGAAVGNALDVTSPEDGSLVFEPDGLEAGAGEVTLVYTNPSPVDHNIALEFEGEEIAATPTVTDGKVQLKRRLQPGEYVFYCAVPGHREGGMEGDLTVTGPESP